MVASADGDVKDKVAKDFVREMEVDLHCNADEDDHDINEMDLWNLKRGD